MYCQEKILCGDPGKWQLPHSLHGVAIDPSIDVPGFAGAFRGRRVIPYGLVVMPPAITRRISDRRVTALTFVVLPLPPEGFQRAPFVRSTTLAENVSSVLRERTLARNRKSSPCRHRPFRRLLLR